MGLLSETTAEMALKKNQYMVGFGADGASVNMGLMQGVAAKLRKDQPWILSVHCFNHHLELAVRNVLKNTYFEEVITIITQLYYLYHNSPKRLREVEELDSAMGADILRP